MVVVNLLLRARNLKEFLYGSKYTETAEAKDYCNWIPPEKTSNIEELEERINHEIMHMDLGTKNEKICDITKSWRDLNGLVNDLQNVTKEFLIKLEVENRDYYEDNLKMLKSDLEKS